MWICLKLREGAEEADVACAASAMAACRWGIDQVPIYVALRPVVHLRGTFDRGDIYLLGSMTSFFLWATELMAGQDCRGDLLTLASQAVEMKDEKLGVLEILELVSLLLGTNQDVLNLHPEDGKWLFEAGNRHMKDTGSLLLEALSIMGEESGAEGMLDDVTRLEAEGGDLVLVVRNAVDFPGEDEHEVRIRLAAELLQRTEELVAAMETPGATVPFSKGPGLQLGTVLGLFNKFGVLSFLPVEIPIDLSGLEPGQAVALLTMFFQDSVAFDYGALFGNPIGLRTFIPSMEATPESQGGIGFQMEWECPDETAETGLPLAAKGFVCSKEAELVDLPHFVGTDSEIDADGDPPPLPYLIWADPTWGGFLAVADDPLAPVSDSTQYVSPTLQSTNLAVHLWLKSFVALLQ